MAKVGEGDPRWIVSERKDGVNVNSWHWEERNLSQQAHEELKKAFTSFPIDGSAKGVSCLRVDEVSEISGDVTVAQRKSKMMCYFELRMTLNWSGKTADSDETVKGKMNIHEVDHDTFLEDYEITITCPERSTAAQTVEAAVRAVGRAAVRAEIAAYFKNLFKAYHIGEVLKTGTAVPPPPPPPSMSAPAVAKPQLPTSNSFTSFSWKMRWQVPVENLFNCLTDARAASMYTRSPAKMDAKTGGQFEFLGGAISGYYVDLQAPTLIKQQWRIGNWPVGVHSSVVMQLVKEEPGVTILEFAQSGIPEGQLQRVQEGWRANFFDAMKLACGLSMEYL